MIAGTYDYVKSVSKDSKLFGFLGGPKGVFTGKYVEVTDAHMDAYRNMGGFDMICSGRDKIESDEHFKGARDTAAALELDGLLVAGGDDSNTNAAVLAENFKANGMKTAVIGVPKTIDGDLKVKPHIPVSFGFDTACKVYSELAGNVALDALSSRKYYHWIRLMGRAASNITLEVALQTQPNVTLISEEVAARRMNLAGVTQEIVDVIVKRSSMGKDYGVILLPEGLVEFIPEVQALLAEINELLAAGDIEPDIKAVADALTANNAALFEYLPNSIKMQMLAERDPHGNVQVSKIETEQLLHETVSHELDRLRRSGRYKGES